MTEQNGLPPYVIFEVRPVEDRTETINKGCPQYKDVDYAIVTPMGSKDKIERVASEWLADKAAQVELGRFPSKWLEGFKEQYKLWKAGEEIPESGTPIRSWGYLNPAQIKNLHSWKIYTIETLAAANQELIGRIGMGGIALVEAAKDFLAQAADSGKVLAELGKLRAENTALNSQLQEALKKIELLKAQVTATAS